MIAVALLCWLGAGCEEISARRAIQEGNKQYEKGNFEKAAELFEEALAKAPHLDTAHYNAGLTYKKVFRPGVDEPENLALAKKAADHILAYLETNPTDRDMVTLLTRVWNEAGDYDSALAYWERELNKEPGNTEVISILAGINRQAGNWDKAIEWNLRQVEIEIDPLAKAGAYKAIGSLMISRLRGRQHEILGAERLKLADTGIGALQKAAALAPDDADVQTALGFLYGERALAQTTTWAQIVEVAAARHHYKRWVELNKKAQEQQSAGSDGADPDKGAGDQPGAEAEGGQEEG